ncbi:MAG TPA: CheR family methyltransferase, partial [Polyangiaceae bacterium]|nr:CheR family methyltransferase [Polyangiaceae bacterium]
RALCQFAPLNLLARQRDPFVGRMDLVLCRNVLIYLDDRARARVLENLYERLMPGGYLLLGHSEALKQMGKPLELQSLAQDLAFRKQRSARRGSDT